MKRKYDATSDQQGRRKAVRKEDAFEYDDSDEDSKDFSSKISILMHYYGDVKEPKYESVKLVYDILRDQMNILLIDAEKAAILRGSKEISHKDVLFILRKNKITIKRLLARLDVLDSRPMYMADSKLLTDVEGVSSKRGKRVKLCLEFLDFIGDFGEFTSLFRNDKVIDYVDRKRKERRNAMANMMNVEEYKEFSQKINYVSFCPRQRKERFEEWLLQDHATDFPLTSLAITIIDFIARETIAEIVDMALFVKSKKLGISQYLPFTPFTNPDEVCEQTQVDFQLEASEGLVNENKVDAKTDPFHLSAENNQDTDESLSVSGKDTDSLEEENSTKSDDNSYACSSEESEVSTASENFKEAVSKSDVKDKEDLCEISDSTPDSKNSESNSKNSKSDSENSESNSKSSKSDSKNSKSDSKNSESNSKNSKSDSKNSESNSKNSKFDSKISESNSKNSKSDSKNSKSNSKSSKSDSESSVNSQYLVIEDSITDSKSNTDESSKTSEKTQATFKLQEKKFSYTWHLGLTGDATLTNFNSSSEANNNNKQASSENRNAIVNNELEICSMSDTDLATSCLRNIKKDLKSRNASSEIIDSERKLQEAVATPSTPLLSQKTNSSKNIHIVDISDNEQIDEPTDTRVHSDNEDVTAHSDTSTTTSKALDDMTASAVDPLENQCLNQTAITPEEIRESYARLQEHSPMILYFSTDPMPTRTKLLCLFDPTTFDNII